MNVPREVNTAELIARARQGDSVALNRLLETFRNYIKLIARLQFDKRMQAKIDPSDIVQETFMESCRYFAAFRGSTEIEFLQWLRQVLVHTLTDRVHRYYGTKRRDVRLEQALHDQVEQSSLQLANSLVEPGATPSEHAQRREHSVLLADALERLPSHYRELLVMRHLHELSFPEIAEKMNRSLNGVNKIWPRALAALRSELGEQI